MDDERDTNVRKCLLCGCRLPPSENICPQCGNVFHKEDSDWEWKLVTKSAEVSEDEREDKEA